jgi:hypothetical protein
MLAGGCPAKKACTCQGHAKASRNARLLSALAAGEEGDSWNMDARRKRVAHRLHTQHEGKHPCTSGAPMPHGAGTFLTGSTVSLRCSCSFSAAQPPALVPPRGYVSFLLAYSVVHGFWRSFVALSSGLSISLRVSSGPTPAFALEGPTSRPTSKQLQWRTWRPRCRRPASTESS